MASHYGTAVIAARPYKPRDKAKVEVGVQIVQRWILARLRNRRFFSLAELNQAIRALVDDVNGRLMRGWGTTDGRSTSSSTGLHCGRCRRRRMNMPPGSGVG